MATIRHEIWIDASISTVYRLLSTPDGMSSWWDQQTPLQTEQGEVWEHTPGPEHGTVRMLIVQRERNRLFKWKCVSSHQPDVPASAWTGTTMTFELGGRTSSPVAQERWAKKFPLKTVLRFSHDGWNESSIYLPFCNTAWATVLQQLSEKASGKR
jgi:uncharacterized protein YndB with AHSA1/START domain